MESAALEALEERVVRDPLDVQVWTEYLAMRVDAPFQIRVAVYERALHHLPGSYKLWIAYLRERRKNARDRKIGDKCVGETRRAFERAVLLLGKMPRIWLEYVEFVQSLELITECRLVMDRALKALPVTQHDRIWKVYMLFVNKHKAVSQIGVQVFPRYLQFQPRHRERYVDYLLETGQTKLAMEQLSLIVKDKQFISVQGKTLHQLWILLCDLIVKNPEPAQELGESKLNVEEVLRTGISRFSDETGRLWCSLAEYYIRLGLFDKAQDIYEEAMHKVGTVRDFGTIFDAYTQFHEGILNAKIDLFGEDEEESSQVDGESLEMRAALDKTFYDVNYDAEDKINDVDLRLAQMEKLMDDRPFLLNAVILRQNPHNCDEWHHRAELFKGREDLISVVNTYKEAISKINPSLAVGKPWSLWASLARVYEDNEDLDEARLVFTRAIDAPFKEVDDLVSIYCHYIEMELRNKNYEQALQIAQAALRPVSDRKLLERANRRRQEKAKGVSNKAGENTPREENETKTEEEEKENNTSENSKDRTRLQRQVTKSTKLWSLYVDLEESLGTLHTARAAYDRMIELKVATPETILNYAAMLEENRYFEDSFKAYEKGVALFEWPHVQDIWINYLSKFIQRYGGGTKLFRARELFEQALKNVSREACKPLYLLLSSYEEEHGDPRRALNALDRLCEVAPEEDKVNLYLLYVRKAEEFFGISTSREVYEKAVGKLQDPLQIRSLCLRYAEKERRLGEIDRARAILRHGSQFADPRTVLSYWRTWNDFEVAHGNEETFREMLRVKRTVAVQYKDTNFHLTTSIDKGDQVVAPIVHSALEKRAENEEDYHEDALPLGEDERASKRAKLSHDNAKSDLAEGEVEEEEIHIQQQSVPAAVFGDAIHKVRRVSNQ